MADAVRGSTGTSGWFFCFVLCVYMCVLIHTCRVKRRGGWGGFFIFMVLGECVTVGVREERLVSLKPERWEEINN